MSTSNDFGTIHSSNVSRSTKSPKNYQKPRILHSKSSKIIEVDGNREPVYDFLLVINSNLDPISQCYWDTVTYWLKIASFSDPLSFIAIVWGHPLRIHGKALRFLKLESSRQPMVKIWYRSLHRFWLNHLCDRRTDRQTELRWLRRAESSSCFRE